LNGTIGGMKKALRAIVAGAFVLALSPNTSEQAALPLMPDIYQFVKKPVGNWVMENDLQKLVMKHGVKHIGKGCIEVYRIQTI